MYNLMILQQKTTDGSLLLVNTQSNSHVKAKTTISTISQLSSFLRQLVLDPNNKNILLVLDIDDTLIRPCAGSNQDNVIGFGSDTWFHRLLESGENIDRALNKLDMSYAMLDYSYVEPSTGIMISYINELSESTNINFKYFLMTSRGPKFAQYTARHLRTVGCDKILVRKNMLDIKDCLYLGYDEKTNHVSVRYIDNICFTSGGNKAKILNNMLSRYYESGEQHFDVIIYIDDIQRHVDTMHNEFMNATIYHNTNTYCLHYKYLETQKMNYMADNFLQDNKKLEKLMRLKEYLNKKISSNL